MAREGALWIGGVEQYMDEEFLMQSLRASGEDNIVSIKVIKNKFTGGNAGYGFINFPSDSMALTAMHKLNGKMIPNSDPPTRFKLNHNSNRVLPGEKNYSVWVGDLSPEVDDLEFFKFFSARFQSIISAKVVLDETGTSKGFGFIRFGNETEQQTALTTMQGIAGLGSKLIKVSIAVQKQKDPSQYQNMDFPAHLTKTIQQQLTGQYTQPTPPTQEHYYNQPYQNWGNWGNMAAWQQYNNYYQQQYPPPQGPVNPPLPPTPMGNGMNNGMNNMGPMSGPPPNMNGPPNMGGGGDFGRMNGRGRDQSRRPSMEWGDEEESVLVGPHHQIVDHSKPIDYKKLNRKYFSKSADLYDSVEQSGWWLPSDENSK